MKAYLLQLDGREEGPHTEEQVAQMFADGRINHHTRCKTDRKAEWRTVDEFLPTLKYGSERPAATQPVRVTPIPPIVAATGITIMDVNVPFVSVLRMVFKIIVSAVIIGACLVPILVMSWFLLFAWIVSFFAHLAH